MKICFGRLHCWECHFCKGAAAQQFQLQSKGTALPSMNEKTENSIIHITATSPIYVYKLVRCLQVPEQRLALTELF